MFKKQRNTTQNIKLRLHSIGGVGLISVLFLIVFQINSYAQISDTVCTGQGGKKYYVLKNPINTGYFWNVNGGSISSGQGTETVTIQWGNVSGIYDLFVTPINSKGCQGDSIKTQILIEDKPIYQIIGKSPICRGEPVPLEIKSNKPVSVYWIQAKDTNKRIIVFTKKDTLIKAIITAPKGCFKDTIFKSIQVAPTPVADFTFTPKNPTENLDEVTIDFTGMGADSLRWLINPSIGNQLIWDDQISLKTYFPVNGKYYIKLKAINVAGCFDTLTKSIDVLVDANVWIPNAFSPNSDGLNDSFKIFTSKPLNYSLKIYDRWGGLVFSTTDYLQSWNGKIDNNGNLLPLGLYKYILSVEKNRIGYISKSGEVEIIR